MMKAVLAATILALGGTPNAGNADQYRYYADGHVAAIQYDDGATACYTYDASGNRISATSGCNFSAFGAATARSATKRPVTTRSACGPEAHTCASGSPAGGSCTGDTDRWTCVDPRSGDTSQCSEKVAACLLPSPAKPNIEH